MCLLLLLGGAKVGCKKLAQGLGLGRNFANRLAPVGRGMVDEFLDIFLSYCHVILLFLEFLEQLLRKSLRIGEISEANSGGIPRIIY